MNVVKAVRDYITKMVADTPGMKVLLLDGDTTAIVSMVYAQSEMLQKEVYLIERVEQSTREAMTHLKAVVFVRPTVESVDALVAELKRPKYGQYDLYFSNLLKPDHLERIAEADEHELVREVHEFFADTLAVNPHVFTFNLIGVLSDDTWRRSVFERVHSGLVALLLSLKKRPSIRFQANSKPCQMLAQEIARSIQAEANLFDFRQVYDSPPLLLVVDRRDDPVTPLLNQWTYQAMVHELLHIENNRVDLSKVPGINKDLKEIVLSAEQDTFYAANMYLNFGEIGGNIRTLVDEFQTKTKSHENIESIADMKNFVENYPQFRAMSGTVSKHVSVVGELSRQVDTHEILNISEAEQEIACQANHGEVVRKVRALLTHSKVRALDKVRLVMLYALRYERHSGTAMDEFIETLHRVGIEEQDRRIVINLLRYAGPNSPGRSTDLFGTKGASGIFRHLTGGLKGVENIYTQHSPVLLQTLDQLAKGKLKETTFPFIDHASKERPQEIFVFMVGGCTYEEAAAVASFNQANEGMRVVLGGTHIHNFHTFCEEIAKCTGKPSGAVGGRR